MQFYQEITFIVQEDISLNFIRNQAFKQLHVALVDMHNRQQHKGIGFSFPGYVFEPDQGKISLGKTMRIFAQTEAELMALNAGSWLSRLTDYVHISSIKPVPNRVTHYAIYQRKQVKSSVERLARRYAKRKHVTFEDAMAHLNGKTPEYCDLPYVQMKSESTDQRFHLLIHKVKVTAPTEAANFTTYGLSHHEQLSAVPEF
ncbi:type I-F CRISPR-associated endoribonuclease Cas6/Csy4 [Wohlfahrtiimonas chitiniclastica]|uniref:type I-F CRISPR-associated endoribonuclease Cas6/Csy4 n=1 Tax=Wohlfahrtiimonas chitiniclastica TaxID=400946 RepID=UPI001BD19865|nr:type I-F CRISPR-associated endoribonuclease Cas6/Csy4 [Wohlfahrtiimonas chitiniclastica]MBS7817104.1 type I-F CRISPR-associated endoribonuclease Cas6/Csy4 [Wohlfahrtiimonas chitiniclastica]MBS7823041.1 type I-F CRISPR-associated endoribonuclease Cas6/Csy4 [Wohlfahrtiimonas chitiniclastica]MBS7830855.1 type I-F CRISPR-associated endoribonuclease Cas6/Csy4 [Wohlfahrtiimonas chitiniclastica]MBS7832823.1 type I-F CRISPR-associated endoribonuclease Cas6/Csy4 [Wohlfahrtiimonas chitiniclastica]